MNRNLLVAGGVIFVVYVISQQGGGTNADGSAEGGTDATIVDQVVNAVTGIPDYINAWADSITYQEGWFVGSHSYRNNNPGNIVMKGDLGQDSAGFGVFSSYELGRSALVRDLTAKVRKYGAWTLYQVMARYAPPSQNDTATYAAWVASALSCTPATLVSTIAGIWSSQQLAWTPMSFAGQATPPVVVASADAPQPVDNSLYAGPDGSGINDGTVDA